MIEFIELFGKWLDDLHFYRTRPMHSLKPREIVTICKSPLVQLTVLILKWLPKPLQPCARKIIFRPYDFETLSLYHWRRHCLKVGFHKPNEEWQPPDWYDPREE